MEIFENYNKPTKALGAMFMARAEELSSCGRHPLQRVVAAWKHIYGDIDLNEEFFVAAATAIKLWMPRIYTTQLGGTIAAGLALATDVKMRAVLGGGLDKSIPSPAEAVVSAADSVFSSATILNCIVKYFGDETDWDVIAVEIVNDGRSRFGDELAEFEYPEGDDPDDAAEGPMISHLKEAVGLEVSEDEDNGGAVVADMPETAPIEDIFAAVTKRIKPSTN